MAKPKVLVTRKIPPPGLEIVSEYCDLDLYEGYEPIPNAELLSRIRDKDGLLCLLTDKIDKSVYDASPRLRVVSSYSVGYEHIDVDEATKRRIYVTNTPGVLTEATADLTWALLMATARRIVEADSFVRKGLWKHWHPELMLGHEVHDKVLGIIGLGRIGEAVARRAKGFNMKILYYDKIRKRDLEEQLGAEYKDLEDLLKESDFVTIHVSLNPDTYHLINESRLKLMRSSTILLNAARGPVIDQKALAKALKEGRIAGAGLDVYEKEPIDLDDDLMRLYNVVLLPHIGSAEIETRSKMAELAARNLISVLKGEMPPHLVNPEVLKLRPLSDVKMM